MKNQNHNLQNFYQETPISIELKCKRLHNFSVMLTNRSKASTKALKAVMSTFKTLQTEKSYNSLKENKIDSDYTELNSLIEQNNEFEKQNITLKEEIKQIKKEKRKINKSIDNFVTKICMTASVKLKEKTKHYKRVQTLTQYSIKALK